MPTMATSGYIYYLNVCFYNITYYFPFDVIEDYWLRFMVHCYERVHSHLFTFFYFCMFLFIVDFILYSISHPAAIFFSLFFHFLLLYYTLSFFSLFFFFWWFHYIIIIIFLHRIVILIQLVLFNYVLFSFLIMMFSVLHMFSYSLCCHTWWAILFEFLGSRIQSYLFSSTFL